MNFFRNIVTLSVWSMALNVLQMLKKSFIDFKVNLDLTMFSDL